MYSRPSLRLVALAAAACVLVGACAGSGPNEAAAVGEADEPSQLDQSTAVGEAIESMQPNLDVLEAGSLEGRDVVVWFWAEW